MKIYLAIALFAVPALAGAQSAPTAPVDTTVAKPAGQAPSDDSLKELLEVSGTKKIVTDIQARAKTSVASSIAMVLGQLNTTPEKKEVSEKIQAKATKLLDEELSWDKLQDIYLKIYRETFTQTQVNDLIAFYKSSTGQAFVQQMPAIMKKSMEAMQEQMLPLMGKVQALTKEAQDEVAKEKAAAPSPK